MNRLQLLSLLLLLASSFVKSWPCKHKNLYLHKMSIGTKCQTSKGLPKGFGPDLKTGLSKPCLTKGCKWCKKDFSSCQKPASVKALRSLQTSTNTSTEASPVYLHPPQLHRSFQLDGLLFRATSPGNFPKLTAARNDKGEVQPIPENNISVAADFGAFVVTLTKLLHFCLLKILLPGFIFSRSYRLHTVISYLTLLRTLDAGEGPGLSNLLTVLFYSTNYSFFGIFKTSPILKVKSVMEGGFGKFEQKWFHDDAIRNYGTNLIIFAIILLISSIISLIYHKTDKKKAKGQDPEGSGIRMATEEQPAEAVGATTVPVEEPKPDPSATESKEKPVVKKHLSRRRAKFNLRNYGLRWLVMIIAGTVYEGFVLSLINICNMRYSRRYIVGLMMVIIGFIIYLLTFIGFFKSAKEVHKKYNAVSTKKSTKEKDFSIISLWFSFAYFEIETGCSISRFYPFIQLVKALISSILMVLLSSQGVVQPLLLFIIELANFVFVLKYVKFTRWYYKAIEAFTWGGFAFFILMKTLAFLEMKLVFREEEFGVALISIIIVILLVNLIYALVDNLSYCCIRHRKEDYQYDKGPIGFMPISNKTELTEFNDTQNDGDKFSRTDIKGDLVSMNKNQLDISEHIDEKAIQEPKLQEAPEDPVKAFASCEPEQVRSIKKSSLEPEPDCEENSDREKKATLPPLGARARPYIK